MATMVKGTDEQLTHALGAGVVQIWSYLPPDVQHELFEEAITCLGERMRHQLALFLHDHHVRTDFRTRGIAGAGQPRRVIPLRDAFMTGPDPAGSLSG